MTDTPDDRLDVPAAPEPDHELADQHRGPLDNDDDGRWLDRDDPRRIDAERRRGRAFDEER